MKRYYLDFERKLEPLEHRIEEIRKSHDVKDPQYAKELETLKRKVEKAEQEIYGQPEQLAAPPALPPCEQAPHARLCGEPLHGFCRSARRPQIQGRSGHRHGLRPVQRQQGRDHRPSKRERPSRDGGEKLRHGQSRGLQKGPEDHGTGQQVAHAPALLHRYARALSPA